MRGARASLLAVVLILVAGCHDLDQIVPPPDARCGVGRMHLGEDCVAEPPSCAGQKRTCGAKGNESCCAYSLIETRNDTLGGTFDRSWDVSNNPKQAPTGRDVVGWQAKGAAPATVSPFFLDRYEVTIGRFRALYPRWQDYIHMADLAAKGPLVTGNPDTAWDPSWESPMKLALTNEALDRAIMGCEPQVLAALKDPSGAKDHLPMSCLNWYEALLFCISDGARLPTEAEWNFAAAGGSAQRPFPWDGAVLWDEAKFPGYANVAGAGRVYRPEDVGMRPIDVGRFGQHDLAGNVNEWVFGRCGDCSQYSVPRGKDIVEINVPGFEADTNAVLRGGSFNLDWEDARTASRRRSNPVLRYPDAGFRCARNGF